MNSIEVQLIKKYNKFQNIPALNMFNQNDDKLDDLHTEVELLGGYIVGFIENYIKTKRINWTKQKLQKRIQYLKHKIKSIDTKRIREKSLFNQYKVHVELLLELMELMIRLEKK